MADLLCSPPCSPNEAQPLPGVDPDPPGPSDSGVDVEQLILCDIDAEGEVVGTALAVYKYDASGNPVGPPTFINPSTGEPYIVQGALQPCPDAREVTTIAERGCANNVPWTRVTHNIFDQATNTFTPLTSYVDSGGKVQPLMPVGFLLGECAEDPPISTINGAVTRISATAADNVAAGAASVQITNVGVANGTVAGAPINPGETVTLRAYYDHATRQFVRLPQIAYDGTGTTLHIMRQA